MGKINDFFKTMRGEDLDDDLLDDEILEEEAPKKKVKKPAPKRESSEKQEPAKKEPTREPKSSTEALLNAYEYAASQDVSTDLIAALKGAPLSNDLRKLLQVLVDNDNLRKLLLSQAEVKKPEPKPDEYKLDPVYTDKDGKVVADEVIEAMIKSGTKLEALGVTAKLERVSKKDGKVIGEASEEEFKKYFEELYSPKK